MATLNSEYTQDQIWDYLFSSDKCVKQMEWNHANVFVTQLKYSLTNDKPIDYRDFLEEIKVLFQTKKSITLDQINEIQQVLWSESQAINIIAAYVIDYPFNFVKVQDSKKITTSHNLDNNIKQHILNQATLKNVDKDCGHIFRLLSLELQQEVFEEGMILNPKWINEQSISLDKAIQHYKNAVKKCLKRENAFLSTNFKPSPDPWKEWTNEVNIFIETERKKYPDNMEMKFFFDEWIEWNCLVPELAVSNDVYPTSWCPILKSKINTLSSISESMDWTTLLKMSFDVPLKENTFNLDLDIGDF